MEFIHCVELGDHSRLANGGYLRGLVIYREWSLIVIVLFIYDIILLSCFCIPVLTAQIASAYVLCV
jgi:hypothetical protein